MGNNWLRSRIYRYLDDTIFDKFKTARTVTPEKGIQVCFSLRSRANSILNEIKYHIYCNTTYEREFLSKGKSAQKFRLGSSRTGIVCLMRPVLLFTIFDLQETLKVRSGVTSCAAFNYCIDTWRWLVDLEAYG